MTSHTRRRTERDEAILDLAAKIVPLADGKLELDRHSAVVSEGNDNGAYVQVWAWVSFEKTDLDKERGPSFPLKR